MIANRYQSVQFESRLSCKRKSKACRMNLTPIRAMPVCQAVFIMVLAISPGVIASMLNLADIPCGMQILKGSRSPKIVVRDPSKATTYHGEFPWMVSIKYKQGDHFCGGFVINRNHVLSAAHCFDSIRDKFTTLSMMKVTIGEHHHFEEESPTDSIDFNITRIIPHPEYDRNSLSNDIVIVKLESPIDWTSFAQPLCLPQAVEEKKFSYGTVAGWGQTSETSSSASPVLRQTTLPILENPTCQRRFDIARVRIIVNEFQVCAGELFGGYDACLGDSGGPLMVRNNGASGDQMTGYGIVSMGKGCGRIGLPGIYTRVANYISWIKAQVEKK